MYLDSNKMDYVQKEMAQRVASQIRDGVYPEFMIWDVILANGAISLSQAKEVEREVRELLQHS